MDIRSLDRVTPGVDPLLQATPVPIPASTPLGAAPVTAEAETDRAPGTDLGPDLSPDLSTDPDSNPTVLADLISAGLVTHEMIGDPARLPSESEALRLLCTLVSGPIWRIEPFHYAFRADPDGVPEERAEALETALGAEFGPGSVWVSATERPELTDLDQPILLLRAHGQAVQASLAAAEPGLQAVVSARFAAETSRIVAGAAAEAALEAAVRGLGHGSEAGASLVARIETIAARQEEILQGILGAVTARADLSDALNHLGQTIGQLLQRLDAQAEVLQAHIGREDLVAGRLAELSAMAGTPAAFQETLGLTLAEFLAQIEGRLPAAATQTPASGLKSVTLSADEAAREVARDAALARVAQRS